jgi:hypothetical protein
MGGRMTVLIIIAVLLFPIRPDARHGQEPPWLNDLTDQRGIHCCTQRDCVPVHTVVVLQQTRDGTRDVVIDRWAGAVYDHAIVQAPPGTLHPWLCMNDGATMGMAFAWCYDPAGHPRITPACVRCVVTPPERPPS